MILNFAVTALAQGRNYSNAFTPISIMDNYLLAHPPLVPSYSAQGKWKLAIQPNIYDGTKSVAAGDDAISQAGQFKGKALSANFKYGLVDFGKSLRFSLFILGTYSQFDGSFSEHFDDFAQTLEYSEVTGRTGVLATGISLGSAIEDMNKSRSEVFLGLYHVRSAFKQTMTQTRDTTGEVLFDFDSRTDPRMTGIYYGFVFDTGRWRWHTTWGLQIYSFAFLPLFGSDCQPYKITDLRSDPFDVAADGACSVSTENPGESGIDYLAADFTMGVSLIIADHFSIDILSPFYIQRFIKSEGLDAAFISFSYSFGNLNTESAAAGEPVKP